MRISKTEFLILQLLISHGSELYGLEMLKLSNSKLKRGTIYTTLTRMEDKGLISSKKEKTVAPGLTTQRRMYSISGNGIKAAQQFRSEVETLLDGVFA